MEGQMGQEESEMHNYSRLPEQTLLNHTLFQGEWETGDGSSEADRDEYFKKVSSCRLQFSHYSDQRECFISPPISSYLLPSSSLRKRWDQPPGWMQGKPPPAPLGLSSPWTSSSWKVKYIEDYMQELSLTPSLNTHTHPFSTHTHPPSTHTHPPSTHTHTPFLNTHIHPPSTHTHTLPPHTHTLPPHTRHVSTSVPQKPHSHQASLCLPHKPGPVHFSVHFSIQ